MEDKNVLNYIKSVLKNMPSDWLQLTTHRLDIYNESLAKTEFLDHFVTLYETNNSDSAALHKLPTAYDYIRLGHPLSSILEWTLSKLNGIDAENVICFSSKTAPIFAILRKNLLTQKNTQIFYTGELPELFDPELIKKVYNYQFELKQVNSINDIPELEESTIFISQNNDLGKVNFHPHIDFLIQLHPYWGSVVTVNGDTNKNYISEIQHVRRRETIAMTPANCCAALELLVNQQHTEPNNDLDKNKAAVQETVKEITAAPTNAIIASSGLSIQYAIMMGLIDHAQENHHGKAIKIIVPPNCYGGTNDQARRVAACLPNVSVMDLPVDGGNDMVEGVNKVLNQVALEDAIPYIIAEIPTNPRVEVPDLKKLKEALSKKRQNKSGQAAVDPVFILDQTFCPNVHFLGENEILAPVKTISYVSGSKFPSGGKCTAGYCVANKKAADLMAKIDRHLKLCDNEATPLQMGILAQQMPSMNQRIAEAYKNTRAFVNFIQKELPSAKINFVSEELAQQGFTPSVFSLDLPTKGENDEERENYKRTLNSKLINLMIGKIPDESKYCVSYGQLKGCYWTIPATSTQGTTKEGDKDYIVRVALSPDMNLDLHKKVFLEFVRSQIHP